METSRFSICSVAKEQIRRRFFNRRSLKRKTPEGSHTTSSDTVSSCEESSQSDEPKGKRERTIVPKPRASDDLSCVSEDDGFPLITSVYSLATSINNETHQEGHASANSLSDSSAAQKLPSVQVQTPASRYISGESKLSGPATSKTNVIPFVVQCTNGVITVCSPPRDSHATIVSSDESLTKRGQTQSTRVVSATGYSDCQALNTHPETSAARSTSIPATPAVLPKSVSEDNELSQDSVSLPLVEGNLSPVSVSVETNDNAIQSASQKTGENSLMNNRQCDTHEPMTNSVMEGKTSQSNENNLEARPSVPSSDVGAPASTAECCTRTIETPRELLGTTSSPKEEELQPLVTKQDDRIRRLKDLLRQKEEELEKIRFKGKGETTSPITASPFVKKQDRKLNLPKNSSKHDLLSNPPANPSDSNTPKLAKPTVKSEQGTETASGKDSSLSGIKTKSATSPGSGNERATNSTMKKFNKDRFCLVNVTVVKGHTRTLVVPVEKKGTPGLANVEEKKRKSPRVEKKAAGIEAKEKNTKVASSSPRGRKVFNPADSRESPKATKAGTAIQKPKDRICNPDEDSALGKVGRTCVTETGKGSNASASVFSNRPTAPPPNTPVSHSSNFASKKLQNCSTANSSVTDQTPRPSPSSQTAGNVTTHAASNGPNAVIASASSFVQNAAPSSSPSQSIPVKVPSDTLLTNDPNPRIVANTNSNACNNVNNIHAKGGALASSCSPGTNPVETNPVSVSLKEALVEIQKNLLSLVSQIPKRGTTQNGAAASGSQPDSTSGQGISSPGMILSRNPTSNTAISGKQTSNMQGQGLPLNSIAIRGSQANTTLGEVVPPFGGVISRGQTSKTSLQSVVPKAPSAPADKVFYYPLPKPGAGAAKTSSAIQNNLGDGKVFFCNVVQPKIAPKPGQIFLTPAKNDEGKLVFLVSNPAVDQKPGVMKKTVILPKGKPSLGNQASAVESSNSEFIPNPSDPDFTKLVGLERVVCCLNTNE